MDDNSGTDRAPITQPAPPSRWKSKADESSRRYAGNKTRPTGVVRPGRSLREEDDDR